MSVEQIKGAKANFSKTHQDLAIFAVVFILVFILSYFFNAFVFLVRFFQKKPNALVWVDEIITSLLTLSIGFAIFSWRRWVELKKSVTARLKLQEDLLKMAEIKAETDRIICKELHCDIEEYKKREKEALAQLSKTKGQFKQK